MGATYGPEERVLRFIASHIEENGWAPSYREIGKAMQGMSPSVVMRHIHALDRKGLLRFGNGPRKIAMTESGLRAIGEDDGGAE